MQLLSRHWPRIAVTLIPLVFALLHASEVLQIGVLQRLDDIIYDARLRATMPKTIDERIVIVDIDEKSLAEIGRWPWGRNKLADLMEELLNRQKVALVGFDVVFAEPDDSSGLKRLKQLAQNELKDQPGFSEKLGQIQSGLDYDTVFAKSIEKQPVVLGYYMTSDRDGRVNGVLPEPVMDKQLLQGRPIKFTSWNGYGANIESLAKVAPVGGFFNSITESDGVVRSIPLIAEFKGQYYESLSLAMFRMLVGSPKVEPGFPKEKFLSRNYQGLESILLKQGGKTLAIQKTRNHIGMCFYPWIGFTNRGNAQVKQAGSCCTQQNDFVFQRAGRNALCKHVGSRNITKRASGSTSIAPKRHQRCNSAIHRNGKSFASLLEQNTFQSLVVTAEKFIFRETWFNLG